MTVVQVQLPDDALLAIGEMARREGITRTEALVRAVKAVGELPDATLRALDEMATRQGISRVEAVVRAVETTKELAELGPGAVEVTPITETGGRAGR